MTHPTFELIPAPEDATPEAIKEIVQANISILDYQSKLEEVDLNFIDKEKALMDLEKQRLELSRLRAYDARDVDGYRHRSGNFTLYDFVDDYSVKQVINDITTWHDSAPEGAGLTLNVNSYGGSVTDGFHLFDTLRFIAEDKNRKIKTISIGVTASMGGVLLQAGDERVITPSSTLMIHEVSYGMRGKISDQRDQFEFAERLNRRIAEIYCERSTLSIDDFIKNYARRDAWLTPEEVVALGFADRVGYK